MRKRILFVIVGLMSMLMADAQSLPVVGNTSADDFIVRIAQTGWRTQGAALAFDGRMLVMSILKSPKTDYDLYYSKCVNGKWQMPQLIDGLSGDENEWSPTISSDLQTIYFVRENVTEQGTRKEKKTTNLYSSVLSPDGKWQMPQLMIISNGTDLHPVLLPDNQTLCFTSIRENVKDASPKRYFIRKLDKYNWTLPQEIPLGQKDQDFGTAIQTLTGVVTDQASQQPLMARIDVYDALTQQRLSSFETDEKGAFRLALTSGRRYRIDVYQEGYSHAYFWQDLQGVFDENVRWLPSLSNRMAIRLSTYDADLLFALHPDVQIEDAETGKALNLAVKRGQRGDAEMSLPIGNIYSISLHHAAYADTTFQINTKKDVLMLISELDMLMRIGKVMATVEVRDAETGEPVSSELTVSNLSSVADDIVQSVSQGRGLLPLRCASRYRLQLNAPGYFYADTIVEMPSKEQEVLLSLTQKPLQQEAIVQLKNIHFEFASYLLTDDSYVELHQVAELMRRNPSLRIEISAHTDDKGSAELNKRLSQKRGESAVEYLVEEEGIERERLIPVGYGKEKPLVPNTSDENRALNRRVEFVILNL